ncbi:hypothetical protein HYW73_03510 [Candidatus Nomurabacteria bacterium]|nr:hypothetical protein [Candidatus Nomurabacteria bacterium]
MEKGIATIIIVVILLFAGAWFLNSPNGARLRDNVNSLDARATVYPAYYPATSYKTLYPVYSYPGYNYYTAPSAGRAYITYPIARSTGSSYYVSRNYYPTTTATSSYYYDTNPDPVTYQYQYLGSPDRQDNCYMDSDYSTVCQYQY